MRITQTVWNAKNATETKTLNSVDWRFSRAASITIEIETTGFSGTLDIKGRSNSAGTYDSISYTQLDTTPAISATAQLSYTLSTANTRYRLDDPPADIQLVMTRSAGTITLLASASDEDESGAGVTSVAGTVTAVQTTHDNLNVNANIQVADTDVANGNPVPVSDAAGTLTVDQATHDNFNANANLQVANVDVANGNPVPISDAAGTLTVDQATHDNLNANVTIQVADADVGNANPVPVSDAGGTLTVDQATHDNLNLNANLQVANTDVASGNPVPVSDAGGSITVDGAVAATLDGDKSDLDTTGATDNHAVVVIGLPSATGHVVGGTSTDPLRVDPTGTTAQPVTDNSGTLTVDQSAHDNLNANANLQVGNVDVANGNPVPVSDAGTTLSVDDGAGSLTVDGTVTATMDGDKADLDSDVGTDNHAIVAIGLPNTGGHVIGGTSTNPLRVDPTGTTAQPITDNAGTLTVDQSTHDNLNLNANLQIANTDVATGNPVPVSDAGGTLTVDSIPEVAPAAAVPALAVFVAGTDGTLARGLKTDTSGELQIDVLTIAAGDNNIGNVDVLSIAAGDNNIGNVDIASAIPAGSNKIGAVDLDSDAATGTAVPAVAQFVAGTDGTNVRALKTDTGGELQVDVLTLPSIPAGSNKIGAVDLDAEATPGAAVPAVANYVAGTDGTNARGLKTDTSGELQVDVLTLPAIPAGANKIGAVDLDAEATPGSAVPAVAHYVAGTDGTNARGLKTDTSGELQIDVLSIAAGDNNIGNVDLASAIPAGSNKIGGVDLDSDATTGSAVPAVAQFVAGTDGTNARGLKTDAGGELQVDVLTLPAVDTELPAAAALADGASNPTTPTIGAGNLTYNGTTWDRQQGNVDFVVLASQVGSVATRTSADFTNYNDRGVMVHVNIASLAGTPTFTPALQMKFVGGTYVTIWTAAVAIVANGDKTYLIYPNATSTVVTEAVNLSLPRVFRVVLTYTGNGTTDAADTYTDACLLL